MNTLPVHIRFLSTPSDTAEAVYIAEGIRVKPSFAELLHQQHVNARGQIGLVAVWGEEVVGYVVFNIGHRHLRIESLRVREGYRRRGVGRRLLADVMRRLAGARRTLTFAVPGGDLDTHLFLRACGLTAAATGDDTYTFAFTVPAPVEPVRVEHASF